jgi:hypothetical protein
LICFFISEPYTELVKGENFIAAQRVNKALKREGLEAIEKNPAKSKKAQVKISLAPFASIVFLN